MSKPKLNISQNYHVNGFDVTAILTPDRKTVTLFLEDKSGALYKRSAWKDDHGVWFCDVDFTLSHWLNAADMPPANLEADYPNGFLCSGLT